VKDVLKVKSEKGFAGIPITHNGQLGGRLLGIITSRDIDFKTKEILDEPLSTLMTNFDELVTAVEGISLEEAIGVLEKNKKGKLPIVDNEQKLTALISRTDIKKRRDYPHASKDANNQLLVGAAIGTREGDHERLRKLADAGVDVVILVSRSLLMDFFLFFASFLGFFSRQFDFPNQDDQIHQRKLSTDSSDCWKW